MSLRAPPGDLAEIIGLALEQVGLVAHVDADLREPLGRAIALGQKRVRMGGEIGATIVERRRNPGNGRFEPAAFDPHRQRGIAEAANLAARAALDQDIDDAEEGERAAGQRNDIGDRRQIDLVERATAADDRDPADRHRAEQSTHRDIGETAWRHRCRRLDIDFRILAGGVVEEQFLFDIG